MTYLRDRRTMACACGGIVTADPLDPMPYVQAHVRAPEHRDWSDRTSLMPRELPDGPTASTVASVDVSGPVQVRPAVRQLVVLR